MIFSSTRKPTDQEGWVSGGDLWRTGFHPNVLFAINMMSGLAEVLDVLWMDEHEVLFFVVRRTDKTRTLFSSGALQGTSINRFKATKQPLMVESEKSHLFGTGVN